MTKYYPGHPYIESIIEKASHFDNVVIDGFAGTGGVTEGFKKATGFYPIAAINHWHEALKSHELNHPDCLHLEEDFRTANLDLVIYIVNEIRKRKPSVKVHIWLSLECTNFSNAKGGMPRDADSRTLADSADRYVAVINPDVLWIENVKEFMLWGPMIPKIKQTTEKFEFCPLIINKKKGSITPWLVPDPQFKGKDFYRWLSHIKSFGYDCHHSVMNMANYGVPQHRVRLIIQFTRKGVRAIYPKPTHEKHGRYGLKKWVAVRTCLDLEDEGKSVLEFKKNKKGQLVPRIKSEKTVDRLINGCKKHAINGNNEDSWIVNYNHSSDSSSVDKTSDAVLTSDRFGISKAKFLHLYYSQGQRHSPVTSPHPAVATKDGSSISTIHFIDKQYGGNHYNHQSILSPAGVITRNPKLNLATISFLDHSYSSGQVNKSINDTSGALLSNPKQRVTHVKKFVMDTQFDHMQGHSINDAAKTVTANRKHYYIISAHFNNTGQDINKASATIIARMDKKPPYLIVTEMGEPAIEVYDYDPPHYVKLKKFMAENGIVAIMMRMLKKIELKRIMTIPEDYIMTGTETDQKKMLGNAVPPDFVTILANEYALQNGQKIAERA